MGSNVHIMSSQYVTMYKIFAGSLGFFTFSNVYNGSEKFYDQIIMPVINFFGPENAQKWTLFANKYRLLPKSRYQDPNILKNTNFGLNLTNPIGITAKYDKQGDSIRGLFDVGYGFVEIEPDIEDIFDGDNEPTSDSDPIKILTTAPTEYIRNTVNQIENIRQDPKINGVIGVNIGSRIFSDNPIQNYTMGIQKFGPAVHYLVVNYNGTKEKYKFETLLSKLKLTYDQLHISNKPLLLIKVPPNPPIAERKKIAAIVNQNQCIHGVIIPTAVENERLLQLLPNEDPRKYEARQEVLNCIQDMYRLTNGKVLIIGDGGVSTGEEAYENIRAGASYLQIYYPLLLHGPPRITRIKKDLEKLLVGDGFTNISEAVGIDTRPKPKHYFFPFY